MRTLKVLSLLLVLSLGLVYWGTSTASAAPGPRSLEHGYFTDVTGPASGTLEPDGTEWHHWAVLGSPFNYPAGFNDKAAFINFVKGRLNATDSLGNPDVRDRTGAAFIIHIMLGDPYGTQLPPTALQIAEWETRINYSDVTMNVEFYDFKFNSGWMPKHQWVTYPKTTTNEAPKNEGSCVFDRYIRSLNLWQWECTHTRYYNDDSFFWMPENRLSIVFRQDGVITSVIKNDCGNPVGDLPGIIPETGTGSSNWNYEPTITPISGTINAGDTFTVTSTVTNTGSQVGLAFTHRIESQDGVGSLTMVNGGPNGEAATKNARWFGLPGLAAGASTNHTATYMVNAGTLPGTLICFLGSTGPSAGSGAVISVNYRASTKTCFNVGGGSPSAAACQGQTVVIPSTFKSVCTSTVTWDGSGLSPGVGETLSVEAYGGENGAEQLLSTSVSGSASFTYDDTGVSYVEWSITDDATGAEVNSGYLQSRQTYTCNGWQYAHQTEFSSEGSPISQIFVPTNIYGAGGSGQSANPIHPKPGDTVTVRARIHNALNGNGPNYIICVYPTVTSQQYLVNPAGQSWTGGNIAGNSWSPYGYTNWTLKPNIADGTNVCFWVEHSPISGIGTTIADSSAYKSPVQQCVKVFNQRFDFRDPGILVFEGASTPGTTAFSPGEDVTLKTTFSNDDGDGIKSYNATHSFAPAGALQMRITNVSGPAKIKSGFGQVSNSADIPQNKSFRSGNSLAVTVDSDAQVGEQICVTVKLTPDSGYSDPADMRATGSDTTGGGTTHCFTVKDGPYLRVYGNDVWAGAAFKDTNGDCKKAGTGDIRALAHPTSSTTVGAAVEYAAYASGLISGFGTANKAYGTSLTFANTPSLGNFGADANAKCVPDYFNLLLPKAKKDGTISSVNSINNNTDGQYYVGNSGTRTLNKMNKISGRITVLVDGDLTITDNVTYDNSPKSYGAGDNPKVPIIVFVVKGNINIENKVTQLDGIYIALKNDSLAPDKSGIINTCSDGIDGSSLSINSCDNPLEIYGSFIAANTVYFRRTSGGTNEVATGQLDRCTNTVVGNGPDATEQKCAAEIFRFSPEAYLAEPMFDVSGSDPNNLRIQLIKDLPPIF